MNTVTISSKSLKGSKPFYRHSDIAVGETSNNRVRFFSLLKSALGNDYTQWLKHPEYRSVEQLAHTVIYGRIDAYQPKKGLELQLNYLIQAKRQLSNPKQTMKICYEQAVASAIDAGVITADQALQWR